MALEAAEQVRSARRMRALAIFPACLHCRSLFGTVCLPSLGARPPSTSV
jgi:hypothetical protein